MRRIYRRRSHETAIHQKESTAEQLFFRGQQNNSFFQPAASVQRKGSGSVNHLSGVSNYITSLNGNGYSLSKSDKAFFSSKMNYDFSNVKIHTGKEAANSAKAINAKAYTIGNNIVFNEGNYQTGSHEGKKLLAHELAHVVQQNDSSTGNIQRVVELRPPGRGEASAFDRAGELIDRLNRLSKAVRYSLDGRVLRYEIIAGAAQSYFDQQMIRFIDMAAVIPLRLITGSGLVGSRAFGFSPLLVDSFMTGYFDMDDMMRSDDTSFQMNMLHILAERAAARNYARRIGSAGLSPLDAAGSETPEFSRAHRAGINTEVAHLQDIFNDPHYQVHK